MKRVLVTGASGFIGRQTLPLLLEHGYEVHAASLHQLQNIPNVQWHKADLLDASSRKKLIDTVQPTHVLHFAWIALPGVYWTSPQNMQWQEATLDLLAQAKRVGAERFVGSGSCAEYDWSPGHCEENSTPLRPDTAYGKAKAACGIKVIEEHEVSTAWGRIFLLYGPHEHPARLVPSIIRSLLTEQRAKLTHGRQVRDILHVRDVASAFVALLESGVTGPVNIASGMPVTITDVALCIARQLNKTSFLDFGAIVAPHNDPKTLTAATERLYEEVGWQPSFSLESGIADAIEWWRTHVA